MRSSRSGSGFGRLRSPRPDWPLRDRCSDATLTGFRPGVFIVLRPVIIGDQKPNALPLTGGTGESTIAPSARGTRERAPVPSGAAAVRRQLPKPRQVPLQEIPCRRAPRVSLHRPRARLVRSRSGGPRTRPRHAPSEVHDQSCRRIHAGTADRSCSRSHSRRLAHRSASWKRQKWGDPAAGPDAAERH